MALPPASSPLTYGGHSGLEAGAIPRQPPLFSHSATKSSINTHETTSLGGINSTTTTSTAASQTPLMKHKSRPRRTALKEKLRHRQSSFRQRFRSSIDQSDKPTTAIALPSVAIFALFLCFLSIAVHFPVKPVWIADIMIGGSLTFGLLLACLLEYRRGDSPLFSTLYTSTDLKKAKANTRQNLGSQSSSLLWLFQRSQDSTPTPGIHNSEVICW